jgi:hypothetical protein
MRVEELKVAEERLRANGAAKIRRVRAQTRRAEPAKGASWMLARVPEAPKRIQNAVWTGELGYVD